MKREEEIRQMANVYTKTIFGESDDFADITDAYIDGAKWSNETIIAKACEWLEQHKEFYNKYDAWRGEYVDFNSLITDFKKKMEE
jgi:hypothetical protein